METNINVGDVVMCAFPFDDNPKTRKVRPAVIVDINARGLVALVLKITSKPPRNDHDYSLIDWNTAGLHKESVVRTNKEQLILRSDVVKRVGKLTQNDFDAVKALYHKSCIT